MIAMEMPVNTKRFFEPADFSSVAGTWREAYKSLSLSVFRFWRPCGTGNAFSMVMLKTNERYQQ